MRSLCQTYYSYMKMQRKKITLGDKELNVWIAGTTREKRVGVSLLDKLEKEEGMIFTFKIPMRYGFWMRGVGFPIDIIWIRRGKVIGVTDNIPAGKGLSLFSLKAYYPPASVDCVIEVAGGETARLGIKEEDILK